MTAPFRRIRDVEALAVLHDCHEVVRPTIEEGMGRIGLLPRVPLLELLLTAPDGVTREASSDGMQLHARRLRKLALEAQLCTSLRLQIGRVNSAKG